MDDKHMAVLLDVSERLARVDEKLEHVGTQLQRHVDSDDRSFSAAFKRIDSLESSRDRMRGFAKVSALASIAAACGTAYAKLRGFF